VGDVDSVDDKLTSNLLKSLDPAQVGAALKFGPPTSSQLSSTCLVGAKIRLLYTPHSESLEW
jgi:hypothetical protein